MEHEAVKRQLRRFAIVCPIWGGPAASDCGYFLVPHASIQMEATSRSLEKRMHNKTLMHEFAHEGNAFVH